MFRCNHVIILNLFLRQFNCASVGKQTNFDSIKMHGMYVKIFFIPCVSLCCICRTYTTYTRGPEGLIFAIFEILLKIAAMKFLYGSSVTVTKYFFNGPVSDITCPAQEL